MSGGGIINIIGSGSIIINTNVELSGGSLINIAYGDSIIINGNLLVSASNINVSGYLRVNGNATLTGGSTVCGSGTAFLNGTLSGSNWCGGVALPVKLLYFNVNQDGNIIKAKWSTASEINNSYFNLERSKDGINFEEISKVNGTNNSTNKLEYSSEDLTPMDGLNYYRLKQTDFDGHFTYSDIKSLQIKQKVINNKIAIHNIGPNPFQNSFNINYSTHEKGEVEIQIIDFSGQVLYTERLIASQGINHYNFKENKVLAPGTYFVRMINNGEDVMAKVIKE